MVISEQRLNKQHNKALEIQYMVAHILHSAAASTRGTSVPELLLLLLLQVYPWKESVTFNF